MANELQPVLNALVTLLEIPPAPDMCAPNLYFETADLTKLGVEGITMVPICQKLINVAFCVSYSEFVILYLQ